MTSTTPRRALRRAVALAVAAAMSVPPPLWAADDKKAMLEGVETGPDHVMIHLSQPTQFNAFTTAEPPRLVVELLDTEMEGGSQSAAGSGQYLLKVRAGQFQREPSPVARVVLYLRKLVSYRARWEGPQLDVDLEGPAAAAAAAPAAPAGGTRNAVSEEKPTPSAQPEQSSPERVEAKLPQTMSTEPSGELARMAAASAPRRAPAAASGDSKGRLRRDILATLPTEPISLEFDNTDIHDVLDMLAQKARINIVYGSDVSGTVTLQLHEVPFNEAFLTVLSMRGLVATQVGETILRVLTPTSLQAQRSVAVNQTRVIRLRYAKASTIKVALDAVTVAQGGKGTIVVDDNTNSLIVTDTLDGIAATERLLSDLDVRPQQVLIEAKLVEVSLTKNMNLGIQWDYLSSEHTNKNGVPSGENLVGTLTVPQASASPTLTPLMSNANAVPSVGSNGRGTGVFLPAANAVGAFTFGRVTNNYFLSATLTAAASEGKAKVLSDPKVTTLNGKPATINITTNIPYVTTTQTPSGGTTLTTQQVQFQQTGITLAVTPTINADGRITVIVNPQVSQPSQQASAAGATGAISVDTRQASTTVLVQDGGTVVIGGLITDTVSDRVDKVPLLGDIPLLGYLFRRTTNARSRVELLIFVTTKIVPS